MRKGTMQMMNSSDVRLYRLLVSLEKVPRRRMVVIATGIALILGFIDYVTGFELSFSFFYLIPVTMIAWVRGRNPGLYFSAFSAIVWLSANVFAGEQYSNYYIAVWNTLIRFGFFTVVTILLDELRHLLEEERILASTDSLTGALNRRSFNDLTEKKMILSEVNRRPYTMVYIDLDDFKSINDIQGHAVGDQVLKTVVSTIQSQIRTSDYLARLGGDEFAVLLTDIDHKNAQAIVGRVQSSLLDIMAANEWEITFSIGVLTVLSMPESADKLISLTDALMYEVKNRGKNAIQYSVYE